MELDNSAASLSETERWLLRQVQAQPQGVAARAAQAWGVSRQAASQRLRALVARGLLHRHGHGAGVGYALATLAGDERAWPRAGLDEGRVWDDWLGPALRDLPAQVRNCWHYGLTEMINNAVDHSQGQTVTVGWRRSALRTEAWVRDDGVGLLAHIQRALDLPDAREAALELSKGKFTTDPARHSGEGIFFTSKVFDGFDILTAGVSLRHGPEGPVWQPQDPEAPVAGTEVRLALANDSPRTTREVFDRFAQPEEFSFAKTLVPVRLAQSGDDLLVSRSQGKRLTQRFEQFQTVVLDFAGVDDIGQAFADEVFRVFQAAHPHVRLDVVNANAAVAAMVARARR